MDITISIDGTNVTNILQQIASDNNMTVEEYAHGIIIGWLRNHMRDQYIAYSRRAGLQDLVNKIGGYNTVKALLAGL